MREEFIYLNINFSLPCKLCIINFRIKFLICRGLYKSLLGLCYSSDMVWVWTSKVNVLEAWSQYGSVAYFYSYSILAGSRVLLKMLEHEHDQKLFTVLLGKNISAYWGYSTRKLEIQWLEPRKPAKQVLLTSASRFNQGRCCQEQCRCCQP